MNDEDETRAFIKRLFAPEAEDTFTRPATGLFAETPEPKNDQNGSI